MDEDLVLKKANEQVRLATLTLEKEYLNAAVPLDFRCLEGAEIDVRRAVFRARNDLYMQMTAFMVGLADMDWEIDYDWPADWWQAFKDRWFPGWAKKRWPVRMTGVHLKRKVYKAVCPHLNMDLPDKHRLWLWEQQECADGEIST